MIWQGLSFQLILGIQENRKRILNTKDKINLIKAKNGGHWERYQGTVIKSKSLLSPCCLQESGSIYLQFTCSTLLQLEVIFEVLEEYDWTSFSVVTTRHHGYEDFLAMVEGMTDGSFIGWEKKSVVVLNVTDDPGGARTKRLLKDNEAQVS